MRLCVALDMPTREDNIFLLQQLKTFKNLWVKVGLKSFISDGIDFLDSIKNINQEFNIFLDLKIHDIPHTMADAAYEIASLNCVNLFTVHASAGTHGMQAVINALKPFKNPPLVFAVSVLTSFNQEGFEAIYKQNIKNWIENMAFLCLESGVDGMVCSVYESLEIKKLSHNKLMTLTPGIRFHLINNDDQKRIGTVEDALEAGSDFIVMGRPIYESRYPKDAVSKIYKIIEQYEISHYS